MFTVRIAPQISHIPEDMLRALHDRLIGIGRSLAALSDESLESRDGELDVVEIGSWQFYYRIDVPGRCLVVNPDARLDSWRAQR